MESLNMILPIVIYLLLIILLIIAIIIGIKFIITMNKVDEMVDDVNDKIKSLDKVFNIIDFTTERISLIGDTVVNFVVGKLSGLFTSKKKKKSKKEEYEDE